MSDAHDHGPDQLSLLRMQLLLLELATLKTQRDALEAQMRAKLDQFARLGRGRAAVSA